MAIIIERPPQNGKLADWISIGGNASIEGKNLSIWISSNSIEPDFGIFTHCPGALHSREEAAEAAKPLGITKLLFRNAFFFSSSLSLVLDQCLDLL